MQELQGNIQIEFASNARGRKRLILHCEHIPCLTVDMEPKEKKTGITVREAGRLGGQKVLKERGRDFYKEIGQKGGQATRNAYGIDFYKDIGRRGGTKGGEKTRDTYGHTFYKEIGEKGGQVVRDLIRKGKEAKLKEQENQHDE